LNNIILTKKISATFLAIVLIVGTISMIYSSFMTGAQAYSDYQMDKKPYYNKLYDNNKKFGKDDWKCNNINININERVRVGGGSGGGGGDDDSLGDFAAQAAQDNNRFGDRNGFSGFDKKFGKDFGAWCININNNEQPEETPTPPPPPPPSQRQTLYVTNLGDSTVEMYDITDPTVPVREGQFNSGNLAGPSGIAVQGTTL
jgi:hypothetical protein